MPYEAHPHCPQPENINSRIWRFLSLTKFLDMIQSSTLHFCRADCLDDPYEGLMSDDFAANLKAHLSDPDAFANYHADQAQRREDFYLTCWHLSEDEPAGMWKGYAAADGGLAICSTYSRLQHALDDSPERFFLGLVQYGGTEGFNAIQHMMHKRRSFEHEHEVRGMLWRPKQYGYNRHFDADNKVHPMPLTSPDTAKGVKCEVNLHTLITGVIV